MKPIQTKQRFLLYALCLWLALVPVRAVAEDIDIFVTDTSTASVYDNPNVLIVLDNTSNWARNDQKWPGGVKQGEAELQAIKTVIGQLTDSINVGLMLFTDTGSGREGGYIRYPVRQMTAAYKLELQNLAQYIYDNFSSPSEKTASSANYSAVLFDVFKYFGGWTSPANVATGAQPATPVGAEGFGPIVFNNNTDTTLSHVGGYTAADRTTYSGPITTTNNCAKNFIIFIGNGFPNADIGSPKNMDTYLSGIGGTTTQLAVPGFTTTNVTTATDLDPYTSACYASQAACQTTDFSARCGTGLEFETCSCSGTSTTTLSACPAGQSRYQVVGTTTTAGTTTGPTAGTPSATTAPTSACYATSAAAATAVSGGTETGGLANPTTTTTGIAPNPVTTTTYSSTWAVDSTAISPNTCPYGALIASVDTNSGDTSACYLNKTDYVSTDTGGLSCTADTATTHYVCTYALKANPNNGSNSDCPGSGGTQQKRFAVTQTQKSYPITYKYTVTRTSTPSATTVTGSTTTTTVLGNTFACYASAPTGTATDFSCAGYTSCTFGSATSAAVCPSGARFLVQGLAVTSTVVSNNTFAVPSPSQKLRMTDEWARYLYQTDVNVVPGTTAAPLPGQQNVSTYTIDVFNAKQDADQTALLMSMARVGGGKYFAAKNQDQIVAALKSIMSEIQAVNTVFASASLPVNATNRAQNENQVFIGMFRPDKKPRWYGNVKRYQLANFSGVIDLADSSGLRAVNLQTGFISECATSYWTTDSSNYWESVPSTPPAMSTCTTSSFNKWSDSPDGPLVEKGAVAEVLRNKNGTGSLSPWPRTVKTNSLTPLTSSNALVDFTDTVSGLTAGMADFVLGKDVNDENADFGTTGVVEVRASVHGDVVHSRPLPVNYATTADPTAGVTVYYGANDGTLRAVDASNGRERWAFIAPEFFADTAARDKFGRQSSLSPDIKFPSSTASSTERKNYFWDGSIGIYQNAANTDIKIFPTMRRGGRMIYAFNVTNKTSPVFLWKLGCPNLDNDTGCAVPSGDGIQDVSGIGQTWSMPSVAFIKGHSTLEPVLVVGGGYDKCDDDDLKTPGCASPPKGAALYVIQASDGKVIQKFDTLKSVPSDVAMVDVDNDGYVDFAYVADTGGNLYRFDFVDATSAYAALAPADWKHYRVAYTNGAARKFFYPPALLSAKNGFVYAALGSGDREHPLAGDYPFTTSTYTGVTNRFYVYLDKLSFRPTTTGDSDPDKNSVDLDDATSMNDNTSATSCTSDRVLSTPVPFVKKGWFMDLNQYGSGEQTVTSALILGGLVTFSTNRPIPAVTGTCSTTLGEARGYWVNLLNGSGGIGVEATKTCSIDGSAPRSATFVGGGLPPSPVTGTVPIDGVVRTVLIGAVQRDGSASAPIGGQKVVPAVKAVRKRVYWFKNID